MAFRNIEVQYSSDLIYIPEVGQNKTCEYFVELNYLLFATHLGLLQQYFL